MFKIHFKLRERERECCGSCCCILKHFMMGLTVVSECSVYTYIHCKAKKKRGTSTAGCVAWHFFFISNFSIDLSQISFENFVISLLLYCSRHTSSRGGCDGSGNNKISHVRYMVMIRWVVFHRAIAVLGNLVLFCRCCQQLYFCNKLV